MSADFEKFRRVLGDRLSNFLKQNHLTMNCGTATSGGYISFENKETGCFSPITITHTGSDRRDLFNPFHAVRKEYINIDIGNWVYFAKVGESVLYPRPGEDRIQMIIDALQATKLIKPSSNTTINEYLALTYKGIEAILKGYDQQFQLRCEREEVSQELKDTANEYLYGAEFARGYESIAFDDAQGDRWKIAVTEGMTTVDHRGEKRATFLHTDIPQICEYVRSAIQDQLDHQATPRM